MKSLKILSISLLLFSLSCKENRAQTAKDSKTETAESVSKDIKTEDVAYNIGGQNYKSFVAFPSDTASAKPVVMVIPEWWGLNDYAKKRAKMLAELGYFAMAVDYYGDGKTVNNPKDAQTLAEPFYSDAALSKSTYEAARQQLGKFPQADVSKVAVIGYCFGGAQALNMARQDASLKGAVSFHGNLMTGVKPNNNKVKVLVCNGANDSFVPTEEISAFKKEMDSAKMNYQFIDYPGAVHSFTNPDATEIGKKFNLKVAYNKEADEKSWKDMKAFLAEVFK